jgi:hypothetical protein
MYSVCNDLKGRVSPFGYLRINACLLAPRSFSQATTSFVAGYRLGIHHVHLVTCPYNANLSCQSPHIAAIPLVHHESTVIVLPTFTIPDEVLLEYFIALP